MKQCLKFIIPLLLIPGAASATVYTDRTAFNSAVSGVVNSDLESLPLGVTTTVFGVETIASGSFAGGGLITDYGNGFGHALSGAEAGGGENAFDSLVFTFTAPIYAFAFDDLDLTASSEFANIRVTLQGGASSLFNLSETDSDFSTAAFFGFSSNTALQSVEVWSSDTAGGAVGTRANLVDNLAISRIPTGVPEPSAWAMLIVGFGLAGSALRRTRKAVAA
jgi:hypothetical protein